jgi:hypothetical protein
VDKFQKFQTRAEQFQRISETRGQISKNFKEEMRLKSLPWRLKFFEICPHGLNFLKFVHAA